MIASRHASVRSRRVVSGQRPWSRLGTAILLLFASGIAAPCAAAALTAPDQAAAPSLEALIAGPQRSPANRARDPYRHPLEDLRFFGITPRDVVVEILPGGGGYWTEILAPYLRTRGRYIAANLPKTDLSNEAVTGNAAFAAKVAADPADLGKVEVADFAPPRDLVPPGSADLVLTFRNVHNWMADGTAQAVFPSFFRALRPGGTLGVEEHRGRADLPQDPAAKSGYVRQDTVIGLAESAGFRFAGSSEANANPKDTKDYSQPYVTPLNAPSHADLPPALLVTCGFDMLRDVGHAYAKKLAAAGNDLTYAHYPDLPHGIVQMTMHSEACLAATEEVARLLARKLAAAS